MKKVLKWAGIVLGSILGLLIIAAVALYFVGGSRIDRSYDIQVESVAIPTDEEAIARGQHLVQSIAG